VILVGSWESFLCEPGTTIQHGTKWMSTKVLLPNEEFLQHHRINDVTLDITTNVEKVWMQMQQR